MKKLERIKTTELFALMALSLLCFYLIIVRSNVYHTIADNRELQLVCVLLWVTLFTAFIFVFLDFSLYSKQKNEFNALDYAVHSDSLAKIANRQGIDDLIEQYIDKPLPLHMGCIMFLLTSLNEVNKQSRAEGNMQIRNFSIILKLASTDICFVGRNGGNVFMAIFEDTTREKINSFINRIEEKVSENNKNRENLPMYYQYGLAFEENEDIRSINALISLANKRAHSSDTFPNNVTKIEDVRSKFIPLPSEQEELKKATYVESKVSKEPAQDAPEKSYKTGSTPSFTKMDIPSFVTVIDKVEAEVVTEDEIPIELKQTNIKKQDVITLEEGDYRYSDEEILHAYDDYKEAI